MSIGQYVYPTLAEAVGGTAFIALGSNYIMPSILGSGNSICIVGGSGSASGIVANTPSSKDSKWPLYLKMMVDLAMFMLGAKVGGWLEQRYYGA